MIPHPLFPHATLHLATTNAGKIAEFRALLAPLGYTVAPLDDPQAFEVVEDGDTFAANAGKKAQALVQRSGNPALADDSGLVVDALGGAPGVHSARYAGVEGEGQDQANRTKLLEALRDIPPQERTARFVCALAYCAPDDPPRIFSGELEGVIAAAERGDNGFGYDSLFFLPNRGCTTAQLSRAEKNAISHRGKALRAFVAFLREQDRAC